MCLHLCGYARIVSVRVHLIEIQNRKRKQEQHQTDRDRNSGKECSKENHTPLKCKRMPINYKCKSWTSAYICIKANYMRSHIQ